MTKRPYKGKRGKPSYRPRQQSANASVRMANVKRDISKLQTRQTLLDEWIREMLGVTEEAFERGPPSEPFFEASSKAAPRSDVESRAALNVKSDSNWAGPPEGAEGQALSSPRQSESDFPPPVPPLVGQCSQADFLHRCQLHLGGICFADRGWNVGE